MTAADDWANFFKEEQERIAALLGIDPAALTKDAEPGYSSVKAWADKQRPWQTMYDFPLTLPHQVKLRPPPTRAEIIAAVWAETEEQYPEKATAYGLVAICPQLGEFHFEPKRYGDEIVIECEGVIVRRDPMIDIILK